jgi:hypothetical protein
MSSNSQQIKSGKTTHILVRLWRGLSETTKHGGFWVSLCFWAAAFVAWYKFPDQSAFSLDKILGGLGTITQAFNWGSYFRRDIDTERYGGQIESMLQAHLEEVARTENQIKREVGVHAGQIQTLAQTLNVGIRELNNTTLDAESFAERVKATLPQLSQSISGLSMVSGESAEVRSGRQAAVEAVLRAHEGIGVDVAEISKQAAQLLQLMSKDPNAHSRLADDFRRILTAVIDRSSAATKSMKEATEEAAKIDELHPLSIFIPFKCPNKDCAEPPFNLAAAPGDSRREERGCFGCGSIMEINVGTKQIKLVQLKAKKRGSVQNSRLECPEDLTTVSPSFSRNGGRVGYCRACQTVITSERVA